MARAREIIGTFKFGDNITRLDEAGLLYLVLAEFARPELDPHPRRVSPVQMGHIFEELGTEAWRGGHIGDIIDLSWGSGRDIREWWASQSRAWR